jgi:hypothetical protein
VFVFALALASEADKRRAARLEKEGKEQAALEAAEEKEKKRLREPRSALRVAFTKDRWRQANSVSIRCIRTCV